MISFFQASHDDLIFMQVPGRAADGGGPGTASAERIQKNAKHSFHIGSGEGRKRRGPRDGKRRAYSEERRAFFPWDSTCACLSALCSDYNTGHSIRKDTKSILFDKSVNF